MDCPVTLELQGPSVYSLKEAENRMIEFTKLHLQAQLEAILKNARTCTKGWSDGYEHWEIEEVDRDSIINAYSLDKIK